MEEKKLENTNWIVNHHNSLLPPHPIEHPLPQEYIWPLLHISPSSTIHLKLYFHPFSSRNFSLPTPFSTLSLKKHYTGPTHLLKGKGESGGESESVKIHLTIGKGVEGELVLGVGAGKNVTSSTLPWIKEFQTHEEELFGSRSLWSDKLFHLRPSCLSSSS